jgi:hypothetical protein
MVVIKGKEKILKKPIDKSKIQMSNEAKRKLRRPQDNQPIAVVAV